MEPRRLRLFVTAALLGAGFVAQPGADAGRVPAVPAAVTEERTGSMIDLANEERRRAGLPKLRRNDRLMRAAQAHAEQSAAAGRLAHVLTGTRYPRPEDRLAASAYQWSAFGENVALNQPSSAAATSAWMKSPGHRKNLLSPEYIEIGTGFAVDAAGRPYYVQVFGRPK